MKYRTCFGGAWLRAIRQCFHPSTMRMERGGEDSELMVVMIIVVIVTMMVMITMIVIQR